MHLEPHDHRIYNVNIDLHHQYGISVIELQTILLAKRPQVLRSEKKQLFSQSNTLRPGLDAKISIKNQARVESIISRWFLVLQWHSSLCFYFSLCLLSCYYFFFFASHVSFFFSCWAFNLVGIILVGKVRETFRILGLDERKSTHVHVYVGV